MTTGLNMNKSTSIFIACACAIAVVPRIVPMPIAYNLSALGALALVCGATVQPRWLGLAIPLLCRLMTDFWIEAKSGYGFYNSMIFDYAAYALIFGLGTVCLRKGWLGALAGGIMSAAIFFFISNLGVWLLAPEHAYTRDFSGLMNCFVAAIPFAKGTLAGDLLYSVAFFSVLSVLPVPSPSADASKTSTSASLASTSGD